MINSLPSFVFSGIIQSVKEDFLLSDFVRQVWSNRCRFVNQIPCEQCTIEFCSISFFSVVVLLFWGTSTYLPIFFLIRVIQLSEQLLDCVCMMAEIYKRKRTGKPLCAVPAFFRSVFLPVGYRFISLNSSRDWFETLSDTLCI